MPPLKWKKQASKAIDVTAFKDYEAQRTKVRFVPSEAKAVVIQVSGPCPVCRHEFTYEHPLVTVRGFREVTTERLVELADSLGSEGGDEDIVITCMCENDHPGQDKVEETGCGSRWSLGVRWGE